MFGAAGARYLCILMRRFLSVILSLALLLQTFYTASIVTFYYTNKGYVATALCENKDKPQLHCEGKCFLKKELKNAEDESNKSKKGGEQQEIVLALPVLPVSLPAAFQPKVEKPVKTFVESQYRHLYLSETFHPPGVC